jgi:hypothetical protein
MGQLAIHDRLLRRFILDALHEQPTEQIALAIADQLEAGEYRVVSEFGLDRHDQLDPASLTARVDVWMLDGWATLCWVHWTQLGLEWADVMAEVENVYRQQEEGTYPDGPKDPDRRPV